MKRFALALVCLSSVAHAGSIKGTVLFEGEPPTQDKLQRDSDPKCSKDRTDEAIVVTKGKLRDVVVRIKNGTTGKHTPPTTPVLIDQKDCMYTPRVVGIVAGQKLLVRNSDNTFHNVWGQVAGKDAFNKPQAPKSSAVQDSPFFAVTGTDGSFVIKDLPQGTYELEAWHPTLGTKTIKVVIGKGKRADVTARFSYKRDEM